LCGSVAKFGSRQSCRRSGPLSGGDAEQRLEEGSPGDDVVPPIALTCTFLIISRDS
jgi:hypothetical protein